MDRQKRILAIHDISCFGRCSLTVALPIISAVGLEVCPLPTAILSTHTGGFSGFTYRDLTVDINPIINHWNSLDIGFDAVYSGFLGSSAQLNQVSQIFDNYKRRNPQTLLMVDPVMGDDGVFYATITTHFIDGMRSLCAKADIITPNVTEACFLLQTDFIKPPYTKEYIENILRGLSEIGPKMVVLTGVEIDGGQIGAVSFDREKNEIKYALSNIIDGKYHGTGDVFSSTLLAGLMKNKPLAWAARVAVDYTTNAIVRTKKADTDSRYGVNFEEGIKDLIATLA